MPSQGESNPAARVAPAAAPYPTPAAAPSLPNAEPVVGIIAYTNRRKGLFKNEGFNLVVTHRRIIFAAVTTQMMKEAAAQALENAKAQGKGLLGRTGAVWSSRAAVWQRYLSMPIESILAEQPDNFFVPLEQIKSARANSNHGDDDNGKDTLTLDTVTGKINLELSDTGANAARKLLKQVLGNRMR